MMHYNRHHNHNHNGVGRIRSIISTYNLLLLFVCIVFATVVNGFTITGSLSRITTSSLLSTTTASDGGTSTRTTAADGTSSSESTSSSSQQQQQRPLQQNWWPVILETALETTKPNPIELLDQKLVLWKQRQEEEGSSSSFEDVWSCLDDQCAHRFAPLSEGRIVDYEEEEPKPSSSSKKPSSSSDDDDSSSNDKNCNNAGCSKRLQCAYHGWEFGSNGSCKRIPQQALDEDSSSKSNDRIKVQSYPLRLGAGMVWVWTDPSTKELAKSIELPISNLLQRFDDAGSTARGYMRDLPYGMELLGENLVDISHLPFSHHNVGTLNRADGRPVPLKMLSSTERSDVAQKQLSTNVIPIFQASVIDPANSDPELVSAWKYNPMIKSSGADKSKAVATVGFFDPCHVRYHRNPGMKGRSYEINLFISPTTAGKSRVFLLTPFELTLPPPTPSPPKPKQEEKEDEKSNNDNGDDDDDTTSKTSTPQPSTPQPSTSIMKDEYQKKSGGDGGKYLSKIKSVVSKLVPFGKKNKKASSPGGFPPYLGHMVAHQIFDGDGIFLNKQGDRMRRSNLTFRNYQTPTSSDSMVNAFRRWLEKTSDITLNSTTTTTTTTGGATSIISGSRAVMAATGRKVEDGSYSAYMDSRLRSDMLDRYTSHTSKCKICLEALDDFKKQRQQLSWMKTALIGSTGASAVLCASTILFTMIYSIMTLILRLRGRIASTSSMNIGGMLMKFVLPAVLSTAVGAFVSYKASKKVAANEEYVIKEIQKFYFEDYIHAEKN